MATTTAADPVPTYTIDLAQPPRQRYAAVCNDFGARMRSLTSLFDELLESVIASTRLCAIVNGIAKVCLRRVYDNVENEEVKGVSEATGVPIYLLVALNNLLDMLLGCTSGAVPVLPGKKSSRKRGVVNGDEGGETEGGTGDDGVRLMHFRTLDWGMDALRDLLVVLEFVDSSSERPRHVIARSITYAGFVGTLTAIRKDLSLSLNFRPNHDCSGRKLRWHQLLVLLGRRRSIGSTLRAFIFKPPGVGVAEKASSDQSTSQIQAQANILASTQSAPCYLILCNGQEAAVIEKDYKTGRIRTATDFIAQTNHDHEDQQASSNQTAEEAATHRREIISSTFDVEGWIEESTSRLNCIEQRWNRRVRTQNSSNAAGDGVQASRPRISEDTLRRWVAKYPTMNECTHYAVIMDPKADKIRWLKRGEIESNPE